MWRCGRSNQLIRAIQLRREREGPYFHQFVVFELKDGGGLFRIDRRLRPDEGTPLNCLKDEGIEAFDTIEPVASWDDPLFVASNCLIEIEFKADVHLGLILDICAFRTLQDYAHISPLREDLIKHAGREYDKIWGALCTECIREAIGSPPLYTTQQNMVIRVNRKEM
ncbi:hypothetical protein FRC11_011616, partial [Ceratobasidium sp. 423]